MSVLLQQRQHSYADDDFDNDPLLCGGWSAPHGKKHKTAVAPPAPIVIPLGQSHREKELAPQSDENIALDRPQNTPSAPMTPKRISARILARSTPPPSPVEATLPPYAVNWSKEQLNQLELALAHIKPTEERYFAKLARQVQGKSIQECQRFVTERNAFIATKVAPPARSRPSTIPAARASSSVGHVKKAPLPTPALATSLHVEKGKLLTGLLGRQDRRLSRKQLHLRSAKKLELLMKDTQKDDFFSSKRFGGLVRDISCPMHVVGGSSILAPIEMKEERDIGCRRKRSRPIEPMSGFDSDEDSLDMYHPILCAPNHDTAHADLVHFRQQILSVSSSKRHTNKEKILLPSISVRPLVEEGSILPDDDDNEYTLSNSDEDGSVDDYSMHM